MTNSSSADFSGRPRTDRVACAQRIRDQQHPQEKNDRQILNQLLEAKAPIDYNLAELARLRIRYHGFPGAREIKTDLDRVLQQWNLTEEQLFDRTRILHAKGTVYKKVETQQEDLS
ncbi:MAG: DUF3288 family protein [Hormoscilla sp. GM102CHS1]|nr:DUF3288 family protein [Hormoscilla sp. GM102CHS1]